MIAAEVADGLRALGRDERSYRGLPDDLAQLYREHDARAVAALRRHVAAISTLIDWYDRQRDMPTSTARLVRVYDRDAA